MTMQFRSLFLMEFKRIWTRAKYIALGVVTLIISLLALMPKLTGALDSDFAMFIPEQAVIVSTILSSIVTISVLFFTVGTVANDIKNHWFRTVLSRPVSREVFISAKLLALISSVFVVMLLTTLLPLIIFNATSPVEIKFNFLNLMMVYLYYLLHSSLMIVVAVWLSMLVPGIFNILILAIWMISENIVSPIVSLFLWDVKAALIFQDFYFPNGFLEASQAFLSNSKFFSNELIWGLVALTFFAALLYSTINLIKIDFSSDD